MCMKQVPVFLVVRDAWHFPITSRPQPPSKGGVRPSIGKGREWHDAWRHREASRWATDNVIGAQRPFVGLLRSVRLPARPSARLPGRSDGVWQQSRRRHETEASALRRYFTARVRTKRQRRTVSYFVRLSEIGFSVSEVKPLNHRTVTFRASRIVWETQSRNRRFSRRNTLNVSL